MHTAALKQNLLRNLSNLPGWRTRRHIVVIESDDWGSIRMASHESFRRLRDADLPASRSSAATTIDSTGSKATTTWLF